MLLVADEIFTGLGRCGRWFAVDAEGVQPDLLCCGKALGGGLPIGAVIGERRWMSAWDRGGEALHTGTFVAHPLACAAGLAVLEVLASERLPRRASRLGRWIGSRVEDWPTRFGSLVAVRGRGLMWALELADPETARRLSQELLCRGLLALVGGPSGCVLQLMPPLVIATSLLELSFDLIEGSFAVLRRP